VAGRVEQIRRRIAAACARAGRDPAEVTLVGVSKGFDADAAAEACAAGLADLGENRVQEAAVKIEALAARGVRPRWHLIGHLQTNKVRDALRLFGILHSIDSVRLAQEVSKRATTPVAVLLEVNVAQEATKFGFAPEEVSAALAQIALKIVNWRDLKPGTRGELVALWQPRELS